MKAKMESNQASLAVIGVDIGKEVFHIVGLGVDGKIAFRRKIRRSGLRDAFEKLPPCIVGMEACLSAHFVSRLLRALEHKPRIIPRSMSNPSSRARRTITTMPRRSPRQRCDRIRAWSKRRAKTSSICRPVIASDPDWSLVERRQSTRSELFSSSKASRSGLARAPFATRSSQYWRTEGARSRRKRPV